MAKSITITNGTGSSNVANGSYNVTAEVTGYNNTSIEPATIAIESGTDTYAFTISATGTLTLHVTEDGTESGTPIVGATFIRTDSAGKEYGSEITTDESGNAVFSGVPFASPNAPLIYFKQTASDGSHDFSTDVQNTSLTTDTEVLEITNSLSALRTFTLVDANYSGLPIETATLTLE